MAKQRLEEAPQDGIEYGKLLKSVEDLNSWKHDLGKTLTDFIKSVNDQFHQQSLQIQDIVLRQQSQFDVWCKMKEEEIDRKLETTKKKVDQVWTIGKVLMWLASASGFVFLLTMLKEALEK